MDADRQRLADVMEDRRVQLRLKWIEVARRADMSESNLVRIRKGDIALTPLAARAIEDALEWEPKSVEAILRGEAPRPQLPPNVPPIPEGVRVDPADWAVMTPDERTAYVRIVTGVRRRRQQASRGA